MRVRIALIFVRIAALGILWSSALAAQVRVPAQTSAPRVEHRVQIDDYLDRMARFGFSSSVLVVDGGRTLIEKGYGFANRRTGSRITSDTPFNIGSLTKQFTAAAILRLEQDGRLSIEDPISKHLEGVPVDKAAVTIDQLLSQTGGFAREVVKPTQRLTRDETVAKILASPLATKPGTEFHYSNSGYQLLAAIIEQASGKPFATYLRETFFAPLDMRSTGTVQENRWAEQSIAQSYNEWKSLGSWTTWPRGWNDGTGNGNIVSTTGDLKKWVFALRDNRALDGAHTAQLFQRRVAADEPGQFYGYGWYVVPAAAGQTDVVYHGGDNPGYHSELRWNRAKDRVIVVLTNVEWFDDSGAGLALHKKVIANTIAKFLNDQPVDLPPKVERASAGSRGALLSGYTLADPGLSLVRDGPVVAVAADGQRAVNRLWQPNPEEAARYDQLNAKALRLVGQMASGDDAGLRARLAPTEQSFIEGWLSDWSDFRRQLGQYRGVVHVASMTMPWDPALVRTTAILKFARGKMDFQFTWKGDTLTETLDARGLQHDFILPAAAGRDSVEMYEPISGRHGRLPLKTRFRATSK